MAPAAHDPSKAPLAPNARFTEQTQVLAIGEGLWKTATEAPTTFKIYVADPVAGQLGAIVMLKDAVGPAQLALRLVHEPTHIAPADAGKREKRDSIHFQHNLRFSAMTEHVYVRWVVII